MPLFGDFHTAGRCWCKMYHRHGPIFSDAYGLLYPQYVPTEWSPDVQDAIGSVYKLLDEINKQPLPKKFKEIEWAATMVKMHLLNADMNRKRGEFDSNG